MKQKCEASEELKRISLRPRVVHLVDYRLEIGD